MECEYTLSSISNNGSFLSYPMINKRQMLLDWINTINEPQCLLVSGINDLKDGKVFIEIVKHFLYVNNNKQLLYEFFSNDINSSTPLRKIQITIEILIKVSNEEVQNILEKFYNMSERIFKDDEMLIEFLSLVRDIIDKDLVLNDDELTNSQYQQQNEYYQNHNINSNEDNCNAIYQSQPIQREEQYSSYNKYITNNQVNTLGTLNSNQNSGRGQYNFKKDIYQQRRIDNNPYYVNQDFQEPPQDDYNEHYTQQYNQYKPPTLSNEEYIPKLKSIDSIEYQESIKERKSEPQIQMQITHSNSINISPSKRQDERPKSSKRNISYATNNTASNISFNTSNNDTSFFINDANKLYNKKQKAIINMTRGIANANRLYNIDYSMFQLKYLKFFKPSEPIIEVNYNNIKKYHILTKISETEPVQKKQELPKKIPTSIKKSSYVMNGFKKQAVSQRITAPIKEMTQAYSSHQQESLETVNDGVSMTLKTKVYNWLVELGIIKEKIITIEQLPSICINGVLLCDLVNRCEGREEKIKGIIRKTITRSQIQVNINKVLDYLRSIEKFSSQHLWSGSEIAKGDRKVIWELLDDLCSFYGKQNIIYSRTRSTNVSFARNRTHSLFNTEQKQKVSSSFFVKQNDKEDINRRKETETFFDESIHTYNTNKDFNISNISNLNKPPQTATKNKKNTVLFNSIPNPNILNHIENDDSQMFSVEFSKPLRNRNSYLKQTKPLPRPMNQGSFKRIRSADKLRCPKSESKTNNSYMNNSHFRYRGLLTNQSNGTNMTKSFIIF